MSSYVGLRRAGSWRLKQGSLELAYQEGRYPLHPPKLAVLPPTRASAGRPSMIPHQQVNIDPWLSVRLDGAVGPGQNALHYTPLLTSARLYSYCVQLELLAKPGGGCV